MKWSNPLAVLLFAALPLATFYSAQVSQPSKVHQLFLEDQQDRAGVVDWEKTATRDKARRQAVHQLLVAGELKTGHDFHDAAFIYQHGSSPEDILLAHVLAMDAIEHGDSSSRWIAAATLDRYLQDLHQPQIFGTQFLKMPGEPFTQEPYNRQLLPDFMRTEFCVRSVEQQKRQLSDMVAGKPSAPEPISGCSEGED